MSESKEISDSLIKKLAEFLSDRLQKDIEVIEMGGVFIHHPDRVRVYIQPSSNWYYLYFIDPNGEPRSIRIRMFYQGNQEVSTIAQFSVTTHPEEGKRQSFRLSPPVEVEMDENYLRFRGEGGLVFFEL